jgi:multiple sugar transport system substrate-binding protein
MKPITRILSLLIGTTLLLTACQPGEKSTLIPSQNATSTHGSSATPKPTLTPTLTPVPDILVDPQKLQGVQIRFLHPWSGETGQMVTNMVDQFNQTNAWGIFVIEVAPGSSGLAQDKFRELMLNNLTPQVVVASPSQLMRFGTLYSNILDLNPYVASTSFGLSTAEQQDYLPAFWSESLYNGKRYGVPAQRTSDMLFYNVTWAKELGFAAPPATWEQFKLQACAANASKRKDADPVDDGLGGWIINTNALTTLSWLHTFGSDPTGKEAIQFSATESETAFIGLLKLENDTCAWVSRLPEPYDYFTNRQALFYSGSMEDLRTQEKNNTRLESKDDWMVITYPHTGVDPFLLTEGLDYGLTTSTDEKQLAAWLFIRWLAAPEQQAWILRRAGTLPLGMKVQALVPDIKEDYAKWQSGVDLMQFIQPLPGTPELDIAKMVLEDGAWALYKTGLKAEGIPALLTQIDDTIAELAAYRE